MSAAEAQRAPAASGSPKHFAVIDVIRGLAALSVALLHTRQVNWIGMRGYWQSHGIDLSPSSILAYLTFPAIWGSIGVPIFFVISGYVIHNGSKRKVSDFEQSKKFWLRRFIRIYPTLIVAMLATLALDLLSKQYGTHEKLGDLSLANAMANLLATVGIWGSPYGSNGALWSLSIEIQFYALYPLALIAWRRAGPTLMLALTLVLTAIGYVLFRRWGLQFFMTYYFSWWLGAYVADRQGSSPAKGWQLGTGVLLLAAGCVVFFTKDEILPHLFWSMGFALLLYYLLARESLRKALPARRGLGGMLHAAFGRCGDFSYSLYAIHLPVAVAFNVVLLNGEPQVSIFWTFLALPIAILAGYVLYRAVEVPSIAVLRRKDTKDRVDRGHANLQPAGRR